MKEIVIVKLSRMFKWLIRWFKVPLRWGDEIIINVWTQEHMEGTNVRFRVVHSDYNKQEDGTYSVVIKAQEIKP